MISEAPASSAHGLAALYDDIGPILRWSQDEIYNLETEAVAQLQTYWLQRRFEQLRPQISALDRLASDLGIERIDAMDDAVPLCFPHTMMKAYGASDVEKRRYDRMNRWLGTLTTHDLSAVDVNGVESLDDWVETLRAATPLDPQLSSGTSGKVSVQPKTVLEGRHLMEGIMRCFMPFHDEPGFDPRTGEATYISPWPARSGPHHVTMMHTNAVRHVFGGDNTRVITVGQQKMTADELRLSGRLRRAEMLGEDLELSDEERALALQVVEQSRVNSSAETMDTFIERAFTQQRGKKVFITSSWQRYYELARACKERGVQPEFAPGSMMGVGGGAKNWDFPEGWSELVDDVFSLPRIELFSMSEFSAVSRLCPHDHWHVPAWGVIWVLDPKTSQPLPRTGVQTGRLACFDLVAENYWAGTLSGDKVTAHWDGGCSCGRKGPYLEKDIRRFTETEGGDDKISCSKTPDAYDNLVAFTMGGIDD